MSTTMRTVEAHWAVEGKAPGDQSDYRILASGTGDALQLGRYLAENAPGTPETEAPGRPDSLPWASVGCHGGEDPWLSLALMRWSGERDRDRRAIATTTIAVVAGSALAGVGYPAWADAVGRAVLPAPGEALDLEITDDAPPAPGVDPAWAVAVAALLLEGRVVVADADLDMLGRLAVAEAVASALPAGYRAALTLTTYAVDPAHRPQRLCFSDRGVARSVPEVSPGRVPGPPRSVIARRYLDVAGGYIAEGRADELREWLAAHTTAVDFGSPQHALDVAIEFDLLRAVTADVRAGHGDSVRARRALRRQGPPAVDPALRRAVFRCALEGAGREELRLLSPLWGPDLQRALTDPDAPRPGREQVLAFVDAAEEHGDLEVFLRDVLGPLGTCPPDLAVLVADLLADRGFPRWERLRERWCEDLDAMTGLLGRPPVTQLAGLVEWLDGGSQRTPHWVLALRCLIEGRRPEPDPLGLLGDDHRAPRLAAILFAGAHELDRLDLLLPSAWTGLVPVLEDGPTDGSAALRRRLATSAGADDQVAGRLDALRVCGHVALPPEPVDDGVRYVAAVRQACEGMPRRAFEAVVDQRLSASDDADQRARILAGTAAEPVPDWRPTVLRRALAADDGRLVARLDELPGAWTPDDERGGIAWWRDLARLRLAVSRDRPTGELAALLAGLLAHEPADGRGLWVGALAGRVGHGGARGLVDLWDATARLMVDDHDVAASAVSTWFAETVAHARDGGFGDQVAADVPRALARAIEQADGAPERQEHEDELRRLNARIAQLLADRDDRHAALEALDRSRELALERLHRARAGHGPSTRTPHTEQRRARFWRPGGAS
ncbi:hypothetical protein [Actinomycetospora termitidis]|uniref:Uncharacterized protein n=1 Tax=Actinomycetospora termitidis TaxID=3053470 RepID=A0ABT7MEA6_9PSEU|nr:hypothetical protein [Actinomycetospora sp. Odt1-22]MDL5158990.1 hypothetical protein [Actinomycetospora sp. Odt1-22]